MRWYILRTLLKKEVDRHLANRGGILLAALLIGISLLASFFGRTDRAGGTPVVGMQKCFVDYWEDGPWIDHLRHHVPPDMAGSIRFRQVTRVFRDTEIIVYPPGTGAIQIRPLSRVGHQPRYLVWLWHPKGESSGLAPFESWFWRQSYEYFQTQTTPLVERAGSNGQSAWHVPHLEQRRTTLNGGLDTQTGIATALVLFALFFICVYLLPSLTAEERERGNLLAQALSPASAREILAAKFLFYPVIGIALAAVLAGVQQPAVLRMPFFWLALTTAAAGSLGVGLTIASIAKTQRAASMGALCYMMVVALVIYVCQQGNILGVPHLLLEYHCPRMMHAALSGVVHTYHWFHLVGAAVLSLGWAFLATALFRRYGWQ